MTELSLNSEVRTPYVITSMGKVKEISKDFTELTLYNLNDLIGKTIDDVYKLLRKNSYKALSDVKNGQIFYIFTKKLEARYVQIQFVHVPLEEDIIYYFEEVTNSRVENKFGYFEQIFTENQLGIAIYSAEDFILLKANDKYLNCFQKADTIIGQSIDSIFKCSKGSAEEGIFGMVFNNCKSLCFREFKYKDFEKEETYWDINAFPLGEHNEVKYIVFQVKEVTDQVKSRLLKEQQKCHFEKIDNIKEEVKYTGKMAKTLLCASDMTGNVNYENAIKKQRDDMYKVFESLDFPIIRISYPNLNVIQVNTRYFKFLKDYNLEKLKELESNPNNYFFNLLPNSDIEKSRLCIEEVVKSKQSVSFRNKKIKLKNKEKIYNAIYQPVFGINEEIIEILIILVDVTHEFVEKEKIKKVMKLQAEFFSFISHEFRTPLTTISSAVQLLDLVYSEEITPNIKKYINTIRRSTFQQMRLVNNLLDITRAEAGYLKIHKKNHDIVSMTEAIIDSIKPFAAAKEIKLKFIHAYKEKQIALDDEKYERILLNLLSNAIKFTPRGKYIRVTLSSNNKRVYICVKDEGVGIPSDKHSVIFERFGQSDSKRSRDGEGTGIGLYLVKLLVESMGGEISLISKEGKGSLFFISLQEQLIKDSEEENMLKLSNNRLVESMNIEFSNIYLD